MKDDIKKVVDWYSSEKSYDYMPEATKKGLKIWEKEVIRDFFPPNSDVLIIGCGMGREAFVLYEMGYKVTAVDISEPILKQAKALASEYKMNIDFSIINGLDLPFNDNSFDIVIIWSQTFGLLYGTDNQFHMLNECKRVLKKEGILSFSAHDKEFVEKNYPQYVEGKKFWAYQECYWEIFSIDEITKLTKQVGFNVLSCEQGQVYQPEDGIIIHCVAKKNSSV